MRLKPPHTHSESSCGRANAQFYFIEQFATGIFNGDVVNIVNFILFLLLGLLRACHFRVMYSLP